VAPGHQWAPIVYHQGVTLLPRLTLALALGAGALLWGAPLQAQDPREVGQRAQRQFETFRRNNLPDYRGRTPRDCRGAEQVGQMCYWYDESNAERIAERPQVTEARERLLARLDSLGELHPGDNWISAQRVRYLNEAGRDEEALGVARRCTTVGWWCDAIEGFALHAMRRYVEAEAAYERVLDAMAPRERCQWRDLTPYLDDDTRREYIRTRCGDSARTTFEDRVWWFSRTRYGMPGNDSRTEHFARLTYQEFLKDAPSAFRSDFDDAEREMLQRFGWPVAWARGPDLPYVPGVAQSDRVNVVSQEPAPAYRFIPPYHVISNPANSDSTYWQVQRPPVVARYHPPYARKLVMLDHQLALFRRGDTAVVVLDYDVSGVPGMPGARLDAALVVTPGMAPDARQTVIAGAPARGQVTVRAPWGPLIMSAEVAADSVGTLARARYGIRPPFAVGARVALSDLLFYEPYGSFPNSLEEVMPHALSSEKVDATRKLGVYWEAYDTDPAGERMTVSLTVVPETEESRGFFGKAARALRLARESEPVSVSIEDMSARGLRVTSRAVELDISTLKPGEYLVQLEISVAGQYTIRADRRIVVIAPK
jgi:tetratricopeptide (TPR) repeat protein